MRRFVCLSLILGPLLVVSHTGCGNQTTPSDPSSEGTASAQSAPAAPTRPSAVNSGVCPKTALVDDFEDGDNRGVLEDGRGGYWYTYKDSSSTVSPEGTFVPTAGGVAGSQFSAKMSGAVGSQQYPYVGMGVSFTQPKQPYDLSCCKGVSFWGKKNGDGISQVRLKVGDWQTDPEGGSCKQCYNDFGEDFTFTDEWQEYSIMFADMRQEPYWGEPKAGIDTAALYQLQWQVKDGGAAFDIQVDDVKLVGCTGPE